jgi:hypothetical protein
MSEAPLRAKQILEQILVKFKDPRIKGRFQKTFVGTKHTKKTQKEQTGFLHRNENQSGSDLPAVMIAKQWLQI